MPAGAEGEDREHQEPGEHGEKPVAVRRSAVQHRSPEPPLQHQRRPQAEQPEHHQKALLEASLAERQPREGGGDGHDYRGHDGSALARQEKGQRGTEHGHHEHAQGHQHDPHDRRDVDGRQQVGVLEWEVDREHRELDSADGEQESCQAPLAAGPAAPGQSESGG